MKAMVLTEICDIQVEGRPRQRQDVPFTSEPLHLQELATPRPGSKEILVKVHACGVCRTELDQIEGRISPPQLPIVLGHQPVGTVTSVGPDVVRFNVGDLVGATWAYGSCGRCKFCKNNLENLCAQFQGTGCHANGGYASHMVISEDYAVRIPPELADAVKAAPLMCAGVTGYRSLKLSGMEDGKTLGLYGFGSAHHLLLQTANYAFPNSKKFVMARNPTERALARSLGADWAGDIDDRTPLKLDCSIDTTPAWKPVLCALDNLERGGRLVINVIRKEAADHDILVKLDYARHLWMEKEIRTVANVTRMDADEFLALAARARIRPEVQEYTLENANEALVDLKSGKIRGSKVLIP